MKFKIYLAAIPLGAILFVALLMIAGATPITQSILKDNPLIIGFLVMYVIALTGFIAETWSKCEYHLMSGETTLFKLFFKTGFYLVLGYVALDVIASSLLSASKSASGQSQMFYFLGGFATFFVMAFGWPSAVGFLLTTPMRDRTARRVVGTKSVQLPPASSAPPPPKSSARTSSGAKKRRD